MVIFYKKWKKYNEIQLTKNKMDLNIRKMTNHPPSRLNWINYYKLTKGEVKEHYKNYDNSKQGLYSTRRHRVQQSGVQNIITSHNTYSLTDTYVFYW